MPRRKVLELDPDATRMRCLRAQWPDDAGRGCSVDGRELGCELGSLVQDVAPVAVGKNLDRSPATRQQSRDERVVGVVDHVVEEDGLCFSVPQRRSLSYGRK